MNTPSELHEALDEHLRNFMVSQGLTLKEVVAKPISELMEWSARQRDSASEPQRGVIVIEQDGARVRVRSFGGTRLDPASAAGDLFGAVMDFVRART